MPQITDEGLSPQKRCTLCKKLKGHEDFFASRRAERGGSIRLTSMCKKCHAKRVTASRRRHPETVARNSRKRKLRKKYGITSEQFDDLLSQQGGACAICKQPGDEGNPMCVDHCHTTNLIRAILCRRCNLMIVGESPEALRAGADYLEAWGRKIGAAACTVWLSGAERKHLAALGGTAQGGIRWLVAASMGAESPGLL